MISRTAVLLALAAAFSGCSFDYGKDGMAADQVPVMVFRDLKQTGVRDGRTLYTMESDGAEVWAAQKQTRLKSFRFQEYDSDGQPASSGTAENAVIHTDTNDAEIDGHLTAHDQARGVTLDAGPGGLTWTNEDRILRSKGDTAVSLAKDDGSSIQARGLVLDLGTNRLELQEGIQGTWTPDKDDATTPPPDTTPAAPADTSSR